MINTISASNTDRKLCLNHSQVNMVVRNLQYNFSGIQSKSIQFSSTFAMTNHTRHCTPYTYISCFRIYYTRTKVCSPTGFCCCCARQCKFQECSHFTWRHLLSFIYNRMIVFFCAPSTAECVIHIRDILFSQWTSIVDRACARSPTNPTELTDRAITHSLRSVVPCKCIID